MKNYIQPGDTIAAIAPATVLSGAGVLIGSLFGVASGDAASGAEVLLMDCMGFVERHRSAASVAGVPVILSNSLMAKIVSEIV